MMLYLSDVPELEKKMEIDENIIKYFTKDSKTTEEFLSSLRDYAKGSGIQEFFSRNSDFYRSNIEKVSEILKKRDYVKDIEDYYGLKQSSYNIILSPLFEGNYGPKVPKDDGTYDLYAIIGGSDVNENFDEEALRYLIWHEFSHSFINPLSEKRREELEKYSSNFDSIRDKMKKQGYGEWVNSINEHIIRAVTVRLQYKNYGSEEAEKLLDKERERGFVYIDNLCSALELYENNRDKYKSIDEFYPELTEVFKNKREL